MTRHLRAESSTLLKCHNSVCTSDSSGCEFCFRDFALIKESSTSFGPGLNVITGESGAGKSIILGALNQATTHPLLLHTS